MTVSGGEAAEAGTLTIINARTKSRAHRQRMILSKRIIPSLSAYPPLASELP
jgi:hypothetical protein